MYLIQISFSNYKHRKLIKNSRKIAQVRLSRKNGAYILNHYQLTMQNSQFAALQNGVVVAQVIYVHTRLPVVCVYLACLLSFGQG